MGEKSHLSRRNFIGKTFSAAAGITILPSTVITGLGHKAPSDKLNIAGIGVGGIGYNNLRNMEDENIVALCDVDWAYAEKSSFSRWPKAKKYTDFREMLDQQQDIDAVMIATPDHTHALAAVLAMRQGKHVYMQTPLAHSIYESRILRETAIRYGVATQMGNQGNSDEGIRLICEWIWAGVIGEVTHVDAWSNSLIWTQGLEGTIREQRIPKTLDWDFFIGPAKMRPYNEIYHPWNWRGWWDFGSGVLGSMGCHILDPVFKSLMLEYTSSIQSSSTPVTQELVSNAEIVKYEFPRRDNLPKVAMPEVSVHWYDGGLMPPRPSELQDSEMMGDNDGGCVFYGTRGKIMCGAYGKNPKLLPVSEMDHFQQPVKIIRRISNAIDGGHEQDWIRACKEDKSARIEAPSNFNYSGLLTEIVIMGVLAVRLQSLQRKLIWDGPNMRFTNIGQDDQIKVPTKNNFERTNNSIKFQIDYTTIPALEKCDEWIRHTYRTGWEQI